MSAARALWFMGVNLWLSLLDFKASNQITGHFGITQAFSGQASGEMRYKLLRTDVKHVPLYCM